MVVSLQLQERDGENLGDARGYGFAEGPLDRPEDKDDQHADKDWPEGREQQLADVVDIGEGTFHVQVWEEIKVHNIQGCHEFRGLRDWRVLGQNRILCEVYDCL